MPKEFKFPEFGEAEKIQDEIFRKMTGSERVEAAFGLSELVQRLAEEGIKSQHPDLTKDEIKKEFARRAYLPIWKKKGFKYSKK